MICFAHRGASGHEPENTLLSFQRAIALGARWIELDVHCLEDELIVIHDANVARTTNGTGRLADLTLDYVRSLDAGKGEQVPILTEVLELARGRLGVNVEIKQPGIGASVNQALTGALARGWQPDHFVVSSFTHQDLLAVDPVFPRAVLFDRAVGFADAAQTFGARYVNLSRRLVRQDTVDSLHADGLKVNVYTVNKPEDIHTMLAWGVDGVFSDFPDRVLEITGGD